MVSSLKKFSGVFDAVIGVMLLICSLGGLANSVLTVKTVAFMIFTLCMGGYLLWCGVRKLKALK